MAKTLADLIDARFGMPMGIGREMPAEGTLAGILDHRTHRRYSDRPVSAELLQVLLACALSTPSKSDLQQWSVVVVKEPAQRQFFADLLPGMPQVATAPVFLVWLGDMRRGQRICEQYGRPHDNNTLDTFFNCAVDAALAMETFIVAAEAAGLGTCAISQIRTAMAEVSETLALPPGVVPIAGLCVGYPAGPGRISLRLPPAVMVHTDRYDDSALETELEGYDRRRHAQAPVAPEQQVHRKKYGVADYYPWSDNVSRRLANRERRDFGAFVRRHGFDLT